MQVDVLFRSAAAADTRGRSLMSLLSIDMNGLNDEASKTDMLQTQPCVQLQKR